MQQAPSTADILNASNNGVLAVDTDGRVVFINRRAARILGMPKRKMLASSIIDLMPQTAPLVFTCIRTGRNQLGNFLTGENLTLVINITAIRRRRIIHGAVCSFQIARQFENTAKKLESYKRLNEQLKTILQSSSDGIWVCDGQGRVIDINEASERLNNVKAKDVIGKNVAELMAKGWYDHSVTHLVLEKKRAVTTVQHIYRTKREVLCTGTPIFGEDGKISLIVINARDLTELNQIREQLKQSRMETEKFREKLAEISVLEHSRQQIIAESESMRQTLGIALKLANLEASNILILGESGTGKGLLARFIHDHGKRAKKSFIQINCAALPESLLEAELFGYEKGAFTGADEKGKAGLFELAHGGTLFLDEIGDLPLTVQAKLLKYLDDGEIMRLGAVTSRSIDCTVIAATNRNIKKQVAHRQFRQDLFYRLDAFTLSIPPLRERPEDMFELVHHLLHRYNRTYRLKKRLTPEALHVLKTYRFPGNVRELKNIIKKAALLSEQNVLDDFIIRDIRSGGDKGAESGNGAPEPKLDLTSQLDHYERQLLKTAMTKHRSTRALAAHLNISQSAVVRKLKKHNLSRR